MGLSPSDFDGGGLKLTGCLDLVASFDQLLHHVFAFHLLTRMDCPESLTLGKHLL
jgi:hypothetical protein